MRLLRPFVLAGTVAALAPMLGTAHAAPARVTGGGFVRDGQGKNAAKTMLTVDGRPASYYGSAQYTVGKAVTRLTLDCVVISGHTAYANGHEANGTRWYLKVVDNG